MTLGNNSYFLGTDQAADTRVGNFTSIAGGVYIHGNDNHACAMDKKLVSCFDFGGFGALFSRSGLSKRPYVEIGNDVWIGEGVHIMSGVKIYDGAIIGAHAVVAKDVPPYAIAVGNPVVFTRYRFSPEIIQKLLLIKWWNWENEVIRERISEFQDIDKFVEKFSKDV